MKEKEYLVQGNISIDFSKLIKSVGEKEAIAKVEDLLDALGLAIEKLQTEDGQEVEIRLDGVEVEIHSATEKSQCC